MQWRDELTRRFPKLTKLGPDCYVVGGAIRDLLLGREPADVDVACLDPLAAAKKIRDRVIRLGDEEHLSAYRVVDRDHVYDFAELLDHDLDADLARRDFTVNAMAIALADDALIDPHGGRRDVGLRLVRMVRASNFDDDPLRTLKGVRMAVKYGFEIQEETLEAIRSRAPRIRDVATERVTYELSVILSSGAFRRAVELLDRTGLAEALGLKVVEAQTDDLSLSASYALLVDDPRAYGEQWRWSEALIREVLTLQRLLKHHDRLALYDAGETIARQLPPLLGEEPLDWPDFAIKALLTGEEIASLTGIAPGKELGELKRRLVEAQVRGEVSTREDAVEFLRA
ncbi:MAG TPA: hypothetical protein VE974_06865 [Thermoanaerobaculia bacterium]|nr:hypothetical protein [Thermoanaerobaculia bacterium]